MTLNKREAHDLARFWKCFMIIKRNNAVRNAFEIGCRSRRKLSYPLGEIRYILPCKELEVLSSLLVNQTS